MIYYLISALLIALSGCAEGGMDFLQFHYSKNNQWWQPEISWKNKYRNHDPKQGKTFIGKYLVSFSDGWHFLKLLNHLFLFSSLPFLLHINTSSFSWLGYVLVGCGCWICRGLGFTIVFSIFK